MLRRRSITLTLALLATSSLPLTAQSASASAQDRMANAVIASARRAELAGQYAAGMELLRATLATVQGDRANAARSARLLAALGLIQSEAAAYDGFSRDSAQSTLERAHRSAVAAQEPRALADALAGIGRLHYWAAFDDSTATWELPRRYFQSSDSLYRTLGDSAAMAQSKFRLALIYERKEQRDSALTLFREVEAVAARHSYHLEHSYASRHIGYYMEEVAKQVDSALVYHRRSLELRERAGFRPGEVFALLAIGDVLRGAGRMEEARATYREALRRGEQVGAKRPLTMAREAMKY